MTTRLFRGDTEVAHVDPANRGLAYGDGLFETMRVHKGVVPMWPRHLVRLRAGAERLAIRLPSLDVLEACIAEVVSGCDAGVLKLLLTRGEGGRGYAPMLDAMPEWQLSLHPLPAASLRALRVHWCETRLAPQPGLAGIKHCNRLEQVLARAECERSGHDEGLMLDMDGAVISATSANLLVLQEGCWLTPPVDRCGVAGVLRGWLLEQGLVQVAKITPGEAETVEAVALCNAVRGILPVTMLGARCWAPHPATNELEERLAMAYPMFGQRKAAA